MAEQQKDPMWKPGDLDPLQPVTIVLDSAKQIASGESKFGEWNLWAVSVEKAKVREREGNKLVEDYTGKAVVFPSEKLHEQFLVHTGGTKEGVKVEITLVPKKNTRGSLYTSYESKLLEEGQTPAGNILDSHSKFMGDFSKFVENKIVNGTEEDFINFGKSDTYKIPAESLTKLWKVYNEK